MAGIEKTTDKTSRAITAAFAISAAAIGGTLAAFAKYETLLIKVGKTSNIQGKELNAFGKEITALSAKIPLSTTELLDLAASAAQIGIKGSKNILKFTETVAKLGTATDIVGEEGTRAIARLLNITGEGVGTVGRFASIITRLGNEVELAESELLTMASRIGRATAQFDLGTVSVLGISAALKSFGAQAELASSAVGRTFIAIQEAVFEGGDALDMFSRISGKTGKELKQIFEKDATAAFELFIDSLNKLPANQVFRAMDALGLKGVRLRDIIGTLAKRSGQLTESLKLARDEAEKQTALQEEFARAVGSLENSFKFLKTEIFNTAKSIGQDLAPAAKELIQDTTKLIKNIRDFNEATGGTITTSIVMAAKISALIIVANKLRGVLVATGIASAFFAKGVNAGNLGMKGGIVLNRTFAGTFVTLGTSIKGAGVALKAFQVSLGLFIGGLIVAIDLGIKLGKVLGNLGDTGESEKELIKTRQTLNTLLGIRTGLEEKVAKGDQKAQARLDNLNKEIAQHQSLVRVLEREVEKRREIDQPAEAATLTGGETGGTEGGAEGDELFKNAEAEKTAILIQEIELRVAATAREAELLKGIQMGMSVDAIKIAEDTNKQLSDIEEKKLELDRINQDLSRTGIDENEQAILQLKRSATERELILLEEKFGLTQEKTAEQEAQDMEARIAAKQFLDQALTEQEQLFLEEKKERDQENRELDLETKATQDEEDLLFLQSKLITEQEAKNAVRQDELNKIAKAHNTRLKNEAKFGKTIGGMQTFFQSEQVKGVQSTLGLIGQIKTKEGSKAAKIQKAIAIAETAIKIPQAAFAAYTSMISIPFVGPVLAPIAAAAAIAIGVQNLQAIKSQSTPSFAVGTDSVPRDTLAQLHAGEGIIPARENQFLQSGNLILGSPDIIDNTNTSNAQNQDNVINVTLNFEGANFVGNISDNEEFTNQIFEALQIGIGEGRLAGFEQAQLTVT